MRDPSTKRNRGLICADLSLEFMAHQRGVYTRDGTGEKSKLLYFPVRVLSSPRAEGTGVVTALHIATDTNVSHSLYRKSGGRYKSESAPKSLNDFFLPSLLLQKQTVLLEQ